MNRLPGPTRGKPPCVVVAVALCLVMFASEAAAQWGVVADLRVTGGEESDLLVDPQIVGAVVPGGPFVEIVPAVIAQGWMSDRGLARVGGFATLQRFLNEDPRLVYAQTLYGDVFWNFGRAVRGRLSLSTDFFDDSARESVRRLGLSGEAGLLFRWRSWSTELWLGARGRRYPNVDILDGNQLSTYTEGTGSGGATLRFSPYERVDLKLDGVFEQTGSRDPFFDAQSLAASASVGVRLVSTLYVTTFGAYQDRHFTERPPGEDHDDYWRLGTGATYALAAGWEVSFNWGYSMYTWPDGTEDDSQRLALGIRYTWGRQAPPVPRGDVPTLLENGEATFKEPDSEGNVRFRIHAPGARAVTVAGSFNDWSTTDAPLRPLGDGWWETKLSLVPGSYEYAYVVDGVWTTPPEALLTVEDGFGGINGILEVLPPGM